MFSGSHLKNEEQRENRIKCFCRFLHKSIVIRLAVLFLLNVRRVNLSFKADKIFHAFNLELKYT